MNPRAVTVAFAIVAALLAASALPVGALQTNTAVGSIHDNDTDFNNANTLTNVSVTGSGSSASVFLDQPTVDGSTATRASDDSSETTDLSYGLVIKANSDLGGVRVTVSSNVGSTAAEPTRARLFTEGGSLLETETGTFGPSDEITFTTDLSSGTSYRIELDNSGSDYGLGYFDGSSTDTSADIDITGGSANQGTSSLTPNLVSVTAIKQGGNGTYISSTHSVDKAVTGFTNLTLSNAEAHVTWLADTNDDGTFETEAASSTYGTSGNKTLDISGTDSTDWRVNVTFVPTGSSPTAELHDEGVLFTNTEPEIDNSTASPTGTLSQSEQTLSIQVNDTDFGTAQGDSVTVKFFDSNDDSLGSDVLTANGTATTSATFVSDDSWYAVATDNGGLSNTSDTFAVTAPGELAIRNESEPYNLITECTAEVKFFEDVQDDPTIVGRTDSDGDGKIGLSGLPVGNQFVATVRCDGYHNRTVTIDSLFEQNSAFLINKSATTVANRFTVSDRTGNFPGESTEIIIQKTINRSKYGGSPSGFSWTNVAGDDLGAAEAFSTDLMLDDRYRIQVRNDAGDTRILGAYVASSTGTIELRIGSITIDPEAPDTVGWSANRTNVTGAPVRVNFEYNDSTDNTTTLWLHIYEYGNKSNELLANTSFSGPFGTFTHTENVPSAENNTEWVVKWTAERDGGNLQAEVVVGGQRSLLGAMPDWLTAIIFVGSTFMIGGLASQLNGKVMGFAMAGWSGMFWAAGVVPDVVGSGVIALSMIAAAIMWLRESSGGL